MLLSSFAAEYGIEELDSSSGAAALSIDDSKVEFIYDEAANCAVIYAEIGFPPPDANGRFGEMMLKANHLFAGTSGGTLCQNPDTDAYAIMRPVPLADLESARDFGAILENVLSLVDQWQAMLGGLRQAESMLDKAEQEEASISLDSFVRV